MRLRLLLAVAVVTIAAAVWGVSQLQRNAADRAFAASRAGQEMLTAMVDQETGLRGYILAQKDEEFLEPFVRGRHDFDAALKSARRSVDASERVSLDEQVAAAHRWRVLAGYELTRLREVAGRHLTWQPCGCASTPLTAIAASTPRFRPRWLPRGAASTTRPS